MGNFIGLLADFFNKCINAQQNNHELYQHNLSVNDLYEHKHNIPVDLIKDDKLNYSNVVKVTRDNIINYYSDSSPLHDKNEYKYNQETTERESKFHKKHHDPPETKKEYKK